MKILVTGATGFIGKHLSQRIAEQGNIVHTLFRSEEKIADMHHPNILFFKGDVTDSKSLRTAMKGCECIFHLAACTLGWAKQKNIFERINYQGTINVLDIAIEQNIKKVVVTSTASVFGPSVNNFTVNENTKRSFPFLTEYERTKDLADIAIMEKYSSRINVCIVCPTRVFGPGELNAANSVTRLIHLYISGKFRFLPGNGQSVGNYVFVEDVVEGMLLALEKGRSGERYILGGENMSFSEFFERISAITGRSYKLIPIPFFVMMIIASVMKFLADVFQISPLITPEWVRKYLYNWSISSDKAKNKLNYKPQSFKEGLKKTVMWIKN